MDGNKETFNPSASPAREQTFLPQGKSCTAQSNYDFQFSRSDERHWLALITADKLANSMLSRLKPAQI